MSCWVSSAAHVHRARTGTWNQWSTVSGRYCSKASCMRYFLNKVLRDFHKGNYQAMHCHGLPKAKKGSIHLRPTLSSSYHSISWWPAKLLKKHGLSDTVQVVVATRDMDTTPQNWYPSTSPHCSPKSLSGKKSYFEYMKSPATNVFSELCTTNVQFWFDGNREKQRVGIAWNFP